ncbi:ABC transporter substrate-binding protein [Streptomyces bambusae]|uniref:ABC transporter substrate-binding protein n=1 Tax=Streptomyces bambusae TaxID=1550616 RepID=A0ABS6Z0C6_9ACTN|nr:ABC transporter substrate-binding protein [Streptomyces bambusae]MBW5481197.1 ABC transporter substrate-binding protein [Streptomyces bambusae]
MSGMVIQARPPRRDETTAHSPIGADRTDGPSVRIGALAPLSRPGWAEAGRHLLAGLELAAHEVNDAGGIAGRPLELVVRDTAADPQRAAAAVDELARLGVAALAGEFHSVVARAAATRADALGLPFLVSSAVLDTLTEKPTERVARLAPPQSRGWQIYADFLLGAGHRRIAVAAEPSVYWASGTRILRDRLAARGATVVELDMGTLTAAAVCNELVARRATVLLLLVGHPEPAVPIVRSVRGDRRLAEVVIGAPAGQPEFAEWAALLGDDGAAIPFLRYLPERLGPLGARVGTALRERLAEAPSFVAFEGYDTIAVLADVLRSLPSLTSLRSDGADPDRAGIAASWPRVAVEGTRGEIRFSRTPGIGVWQWAGAPIQVVDRDPAAPDRFRVLHTG